MPRCRFLLLLAVGGAAAASGCAHARRGGSPADRPDDTASILAALPETARTPLAPAVEYPAPDLRPDPPPTLRRLTARACQELGAKNSGPARLLDNEPTGRVAGPLKSHRADPGTSQALVRAHAADEARNRSAGDALDLFYKLAGAEAGADQARAAADDLDTLLRDARDAQRVGLKERVNLGELEEQQAQVRAERARLTGAAGELDAGLKALIGVSDAPGVRLWPDDPLRVPGDPIDADEAVRVGLRYRPDLLLLRALISSPDPAATALGRKVLTGVNPSLSAAPIELPLGVRIVVKVLAPCSGPWPDPATRASTKTQLADLLAERERQAEAEIRAAAAKATATAEQARVYATLAGRHRTRLTEVSAERAAGRAVTAEEAQARAALRRADGETLKATVEHLSARVRLRQAQGLLVREALDPAFRSINR